MTARRRSWPLLAVFIVVVAACEATTSPPSPTDIRGTGIAITAAAGPTCPVERPGDPACAPRPVAGATILVLDGRGATVATVVLDEQGMGTVALPAGDYVVQAQPANGLMGTPEPLSVAVVDGALTPIALAYDTGIR